MLDLNRCPAVDGHDPSEEIRELVILRDGHCVFPWCTVDARPPTSTTSTPTCRWTRADHRARPTPTTSPASADDITAAKPAAAGATDDDDDGTYEWHGPHGRSYLVTPLGTLEIPTN